VRRTLLGKWDKRGKGEKRTEGRRTQKLKCNAEYFSTSMTAGTSVKIRCNGFAYTSSHHFPDDTTYVALFREMVSINY
jgi:hypothetical protein